MREGVRHHCVIQPINILLFSAPSQSPAAVAHVTGKYSEASPSCLVNRSGFLLNGVNVCSTAIQSQRWCHLLADSWTFETATLVEFVPKPPVELVPCDCRGIDGELENTRRQAQGSWVMVLHHLPIGRVIYLLDSGVSQTGMGVRTR